MRRTRYSYTTDRLINNLNDFVLQKARGLASCERHWCTRVKSRWHGGLTALCLGTSHSTACLITRWMFHAVNKVR
ncbi:hypothetical protein VTK56DRAFT_316 [Thermocarpiscus australiensis]